ncbi:MAG TPA: hypothetical protein DEO32_06150 [Ruminococcaceae bacterium]|nr:hypothetical protein [Oscillospiraceae bacterium]
MITLENLSRGEALRYLGGANAEPDKKMLSLLDECEEQVIRRASPKYLYTPLDLPCSELEAGNDIKNHLSGCKKAVLMCATLGADIDKLIRVNQITNLARAVVLDSFASVAIEQVCDKAELEIAEKFPGYYLTFRFSPGYGDYPISLQKYFLTKLDARRKIGLSVNESSILIPSKSVTAVIGLSENPVEQKRRGCAVCNLRKTCRYRKRGEHCGF